MGEGIHQDPVVVKTVSLHGGMADRDAPWVIQDHQAVLIENMESNKPGQRIRRRGVESIGAASSVSTVRAAAGLFPFFDSDLNQDVLMGVWNSRLYMLPGNSQVIEKASGISLTQNLHQASRGVWQTRDAIYINQAQYDYSSVSLASLLMVYDLFQRSSQHSSMSPRCSTWFQGRLWVGGNSLAEDDSTLWWSGLNDGMNYSLTNSVRIEPGRGGALTAIVPVRSGTPVLMVFKERLVAKFEMFWGSSSALIPGAADALDTIKSNVQVVADNIGCVATRSVQAVPGAQAGDIFFLAHDGFRAITRSADDKVAGSSLPISAVIQGTIDRVNFSRIRRATSAVWEQKYHCAVPLDGALFNTHVLTFDLITNAWFLNTWEAEDLTPCRLRQNADTMWMQYGALTTDSVSTGLTQGWHVFRTFTGSVDPTGVPVKYQEVSKAYTMGTFDARKKFTWFGIHAYNVTATCPMLVSIRLDNDIWQAAGTVVIPKAGGTVVILGQTSLPWAAGPNGMHMQKLGLEDFQPGYMMQVRIGQTSTTDWSVPTVIQTSVAARFIDPEFSNEIT